MQEVNRKKHRYHIPALRADKKILHCGHSTQCSHLLVDGVSSVGDRSRAESVIDELVDSERRRARLAENNDDVRSHTSS